MLSLSSYVHQVVIFFSVITLISCSGGGDSPPPDTVAPTIASTSPTAGELDVNTTTSINVVFSEAMASSSFNSTTFRLEDGGAGDVAGSINVSGATATFTPQDFLDPNSPYTLIVTEGVTDLAGNALQAGANIDFTTRSLTTVNVSWDANRETAVNSAGGGYTVYYSTTQGFDITDAGVTEVDVPNAGGPTPTTASFDLDSTRYYFRVVAYSVLNPPGGSGGSTSAPSAEYSFDVP